jgi:hypothetical protein
MTSQAGCSPDRCFGRDGTADSRRRLRAGLRWLGRNRISISFPSVRGYSFFHFTRPASARLFLHFFFGVIVRRALISGTILPQIRKRENIPACFCTLFLHNNAFWTCFWAVPKNLVCNLHRGNALRASQKRALYVTVMIFRAASFSPFRVATCSCSIR